MVRLRTAKKWILPPLLYQSNRTFLYYILHTAKKKSWYTSQIYVAFFLVNILFLDDDMIDASDDITFFSDGYHIFCYCPTKEKYLIWGKARC